mgnify:CR=1 FL=1
MPRTTDELIEELSAFLRIPSISSGDGHPDDLATAAAWVRDRIVAGGRVLQVRENFETGAREGEKNAVTLMALWPLHRAFGLKRYFAATYQSVSGTGAEAIRELEDQIQSHVRGTPVTRKVYAHQIALNLIPQVDSFGPNGYTGEETKMMLENQDN